MKSSSIGRVIVIVIVVVGAAACGGKSQGGAAPTPAVGDDAATPFDDAAVKSALASTLGVDACGAEASTTLGAHLAAQRASLVDGGDGGNPVDETFRCLAQDGGLWECQWSVFARPGAPDPEDPCADGGGAGYQIIATVGADGAIAADKIYCNAPG